MFIIGLEEFNQRVEKLFAELYAAEKRTRYQLILPGLREFE
jgi:hypothetical protein